MPGVGEVTVSGAEQPAIRVRVDPGAVAAAGISLEDVRTAIANANNVTPLGSFDGRARPRRSPPTSSCARPTDYARDRRQAAERRRRPARRHRDASSSARATAAPPPGSTAQPAILLNITKQNDANVIETVDAIRALLPELAALDPGRHRRSRSCPTAPATIRASVLDMQYTLLATIVLVMLVVFLFLRRGTPTIAAGVTVPLSLAGTCAAMWAVGYSINNLSLMALAISVGFVVDDAIVMIENVFRNLEKGMSPLRAAFEGRAADRLHGRLHQRLADRGLHPAAVHGRRRRPAVPRVLAHAGVRGRRSRPSSR